MSGDPAQVSIPLPVVAVDDLEWYYGAPDEHTRLVDAEVTAIERDDASVDSSVIWNEDFPAPPMSEEEWEEWEQFVTERRGQDVVLGAEPTPAPEPR
jgi:hypothetical protein